MENELKILCPFCNKEYTSKMKSKLIFSEGSYTADCVYSEIRGTIDIYCENCKKLVYRKEISQPYPYLDWEKNE
jgi:hypothetical protein